MSRNDLKLAKERLSLAKDIFCRAADKLSRLKSLYGKYIEEYVEADNEFLLAHAQMKRAEEEIESIEDSKGK